MEKQTTDGLNSGDCKDFGDSQWLQRFQIATSFN